MKKLRRFIWMLAAGAWLFAATGCNNDAFLIFEDGEFDSTAHTEAMMMINSELENDDFDR